MLMIKRVLLFFWAFLLLCNLCRADEYYVSASGNDSAGNGSKSSPWKTVTFAVSSVAPTEANPATININSGTFTGAVSMKSYMTLKGGWNSDFSTNNPALNKSAVKPASSSQNAITVSGKNSFIGIAVNGGAKGIVAAISGSEVNIDSSEISGNTTGISIEGNINATIQNSEIKSNTTGIYIMTSTNAIISTCKFTKNSDKAVYSYFYASPIVLKCYFEQNGVGVYLSRAQGGNSAVRQCKFYKNISHGVYLYRSDTQVVNNYLCLNQSGIYCDTYSNATLLNNTIIKNRADGISLASAGSGLSIYNNIISQNTNYGIAEYDYDSDPVFGYNCFYQNQRCQYLDEGSTQTQTAQQINSVSNGTSAIEKNIVGNPCFNDEIADDYHLTYGSVCIDGGSSLAFSAPDIDLDGKIRPNDIPEIDNNQGDSDYDIGCDEFYWTLSSKIIQNHILGLYPIPSAYFSEADWDSNGRIDIADLVYFINNNR